MVAPKYHLPKSQAMQPIKGLAENDKSMKVIMSSASQLAMNKIDLNKVEMELNLEKTSSQGKYTGTG